MNPAMPRIPRVRRLQSLHRAITQSTATTAPRASFVAARCLSTTTPSQSKNTEWVRKKLWKGDAPGAADPYTQQPVVEETSNLPQEALERQTRDKTPGPVRNSRLALPPRRAEATTEKELKASDSSYVPATSIEGLEEIPALYEWWEQPGHWGEESEFKGFPALEKITDRDVVEVYLRRALVEALALQQAGVGQWATKKWREGSRADMDAALALEIVAQDGGASLKGNAAAVAESLTSEAEGVEAAEAITSEEAKEIAKAWDPSWKTIAVNDEVKFAIRKRLYQLTGNLIPDAKLGAARTVQNILTLAGKPPKAERLFDVLEDKGRLQSLANVKLHSRKIGAIDKEVAVGRWKVIEEELRKRGLPVTGTEDLPKNKERDWLTEKL